eukprot:gene25033-10893_t
MSEEAGRAERRALWQQDGEAESCNNCEKNFQIWRRKHHCRKCGNIYCSDCSDKKTQCD